MSKIAHSDYEQQKTESKQKAYNTNNRSIILFLKYQYRKEIIQLLRCSPCCDVLLEFFQHFLPTQKVRSNSSCKTDKSRRFLYLWYLGSCQNVLPSLGIFCIFFALVAALELLVREIIWGLDLALRFPDSSSLLRSTHAAQAA